jgi:putative ABC transport system substrate-binding protein
VEGRTIRFLHRGAERYEEFVREANELAGQRVSLVFAAGVSSSALAAKAATATIPIVFENGSDPVKLGLVASLNRPGGNVTGVSNFGGMLGPKRLELLRELVPEPGTIGFLTNPNGILTNDSVKEITIAASRVGQQVLILKASTVEEIDTAFGVAQKQVGALLVNADSFFNTNRAQFVALAARYRIPTSYPTRVYVEGGGLMSYGDDRAESRRQAGIYAGRILKGEKPADLPVLQPTKFEFVINLKAAKALGVTFPQSFHLRADDVID